MTLYTVTDSNWNSPDFWSSVEETDDGHVLDLNGLGPSFTIGYDQIRETLIILNGDVSFTIGQGGAEEGVDATLGGTMVFTQFIEVIGTEASDSLITGGGVDTLRGGAGDDTLGGGGGDDSLHGNDGDDLLLGGTGDDTVIGEDGEDSVYGGDGDDHLEGNEGDDSLFGGRGDDWMRGSYDNDLLQGGEGDDFLWGGWGDDTIIIEDNFGNDTVEAEAEDETDGDTLDLSRVTTDLTVEMQHGFPGIGSVTDGTSTLTYVDVETVVLGGGSDTVLLGSGSGQDTVADFQLGMDVLDLSDMTNGSGNSVTQADVTIVDDGDGNAVLQFPEGEQLTLLGIDPASLSTPSGLAQLGLPVPPNFLVEGTSGDDLINTAYSGDPENDRVDSNDSELGDDDDEIFAREGDDTVQGGLGNDRIYGEEGDDILGGGAGEDYVDGGPGDDTLLASAEEALDTLVGGEGRDLLDVSSLTGPVDVTFSGDDEGVAEDGLAEVSFTGIETLFMGGGADTLQAGATTTGIEANGAAGDDSLIGGSGDDTLHGGAGSNFVDGGLGDDLLSDENDASGASTLTGGEGDDTLQGSTGAGDGAYSGGVGDDLLQDRGGSGDQSFSGGAGDDTFQTGAGDDVLDGGAGDDSVEVRDGFGDDTVDLGDGADVLDLSDLSGAFSVLFSDQTSGVVVQGDNTLDFQGVDTVLGSGGREFQPDFSDPDGNRNVVEGTKDADTLTGSGDRDRLTGDEGDDSLEGAGGNDTLLGDEGNDTLFGGAGDDTQLGGSGDDSLFGSDGDDALAGGAGNDFLVGGAGNDTFSYADGDGADTISDFNSVAGGESDSLNLSAFYDTLSELRADQADDGVLNQSNATDLEGNTVDYGNNSQFGTGSLTVETTSTDPIVFSRENTGVFCFTPGTCILTPAGPVRIEMLQAGDMVWTRDNGLQPIRWIASRWLSATELRAAPALSPVRISPLVLGTEKPLTVSPQHGILMHRDDGEEVLVRAVHLAGMTGCAERLRPSHGVRYIHLMFDAHEILWADGAAAESFYPGPQAMDGVDPAARAELETLFPELKSGLPEDSFGPQARIWLPKSALYETYGDWALL